MEKTMKYILQIPAHLYIGGVEKVARDIGIYADPSKYKIDYIVFDKETGEYEIELVAHGCRVFHLQEPSLDYKIFLKNLRQIMSKTKYDVVHAHTMFNIGWIMMVAKQMNVPTRISHAHSALNNGGGIKVKCYEKLMRLFILKNATVLIACGEKAGIRLYGEKTYREKVKLVLNGIDTLHFQFSEESRDIIRKQLNIEKRFVIGHTGHLASVKNQKFLIELMPEIIKRKPDAVLLLLGEGKERTRLENIVKKLNLQKYVILTGNVSNVYDYLSSMDVFAFPSLYEGMPLSIIEVQANGLPCIISTEVPKDVYLTDLIHPLELSDSAGWISEICNVVRKDSKRYASRLREAGFDTQSVMQKIYSMYEIKL